MDFAAGLPAENTSTCSTDASLCAVLNGSEQKRAPHRRIRTWPRLRGREVRGGPAGPSVAQCLERIKYAQ